MSLGSWLAGLVFDGGRELVAKAQRFGRKLTPAQQRAQLEHWDRNHMPLRFTTGECAVCGKPRATDVEHCPGPVKRWRPTRPETARCLHNAVAFIPGCEICDPRHTGPKL